MKSALKLLLACLCASVQAQDLTTAEKSTIEKTVAIALATHYVARPGFVVGPGPVEQTKVDVSAGKLSCFYWGNYDFTLEEVTEANAGVNYHIRPKDSNWSGRIGYQTWIFNLLQTKPTTIDHVLEGGAHYSGFIEADATLSYIVPGSDADEGIMLHGTLAKPIILKKSRIGEFTLTPKVQAAILGNFYGANGLSHITPGLELGFTHGKFSANVFIKQQFGLEKQMEDKTYFGAQIGVKF
jgi:hypothetical protein